MFTCAPCFLPLSYSIHVFTAFVSKQNNWTPQQHNISALCHSGTLARVAFEHRGLVSWPRCLSKNTLWHGNKPCKLDHRKSKKYPASLPCIFFPLRSALAENVHTWRKIASAGSRRPHNFVQVFPDVSLCSPFLNLRRLTKKHTDWDASALVAALE